MFSSIFVIISIHLWGVLVLEKVKWKVWFFSETGVICSVRPAEGSLPKLMKSTNLIGGARFFSHLQPHGRESVVAD